MNVQAGLRYPWSEPPAEGEAIEVAEGVLWIRLPLPMALDHVNVYALDDGDSWTIVDTGFSSRRSRAIWEKLMADVKAEMDKGTQSFMVSARIDTSYWEQLPGYNKRKFGQLVDRIAAYYAIGK